VSYHVETARYSLPEVFVQDGPACLYVSAAFELVEALKGDRRIRRLRIRDTSRDPKKQSPIIFYMDKGGIHGREN
jgi:hypothetical protein